MSSGFGKEIWIRYRHLGVINIQTVNKDIRLSEIIKGVSAD